MDEPNDTSSDQLSRPDSTETSSAESASGSTDSGMRNALLVMMVFVGVICVIAFFKLRPSVPVNPAARFCIDDKELTELQKLASSNNHDAVDRLFTHFEIFLNGDPRAQAYEDQLKRIKAAP
jgi:hypothetical protein